MAASREAHFLLQQLILGQAPAGDGAAGGRRARAAEHTDGTETYDRAEMALRTLQRSKNTYLKDITEEKDILRKANLYSEFVGKPLFIRMPGNTSTS